MNKNILIFVAGVGLLLPLIANAASVGVYGKAQVEVASVSYDAAGKTDAIEVTDKARGRIGIKASEDLGNGMKAIAKFEFKADTTDNVASKNSDASLTAREALVGIKGAFGTVEAGNLKSAYKYAGGVKYDPLVATLLEARRNGGMSGGAFGHNGFLSNSVGYRGNFGGSINVWVTYNLDEAAGQDGDLSGSVKVKGGSWEGFVALVSDSDKDGSGPGTASYDATKFGGKMKFAGAHTIMGQIEAIDDDGTDISILYVGYHGKFGGGNNLHAAFGTTDSDVDADDKDYLMVSYVKKLSKMTRVFAGFRQTTDNNDDATTVISFGMRKDFSS